MRRGEVRWYKFKPPDKRRPVLILTRNSAINFLNALTIAPITSTVRGIPSEVFLTREDGLYNECAANFDHVQTVSKSKIGDMITQLSNTRMQEANQAISFALGIDEAIF
ncbi:MAG: type II toxin-antitoxin system PemK/MazF family toxin [Chloroflexota bacterium]|nr:type II toxin-antitoxin system PemK/MazF family toxin [Chloroflexota bacterium]